MEPANSELAMARLESSALEPGDGPWPSLGGWIASLLGMYLIGTGIFNVAMLFTYGGTSTTDQSSQILQGSGMNPNTASVGIVASYVVGAPIFLGSGLLALGSIARYAKRQLPSRPTNRRNPLTREEAQVESDFGYSKDKIFKAIFEELDEIGLDTSQISRDKTSFDRNSVTVMNSLGRKVAVFTMQKNGEWTRDLIK